MAKLDNIWLRVILTLMILVGLLYLPSPALSQETSNIQNLVRNGGFEQGFQGEFGVGYDWGGFSNGNAIVGWNADTWDLVVAAGETAQMIEIKNATERDRYAGIYQTIPVVPGQQYKLTIKGLIRSAEGDVEQSDFGYRLQYAVDENGGTAWELLSDEAWQELPWDEQSSSKPANGSYRIETFDTTITARTDQLTLFIRGWKKWINNGSGIFNLDEISLVGPTPDDYEAPAAQAAAVNGAPQQADLEAGETDSSTQAATPEEKDAASRESNAMGSQTDQTRLAQTEAQLPVSGRGQDDTINYVLLSSLFFLLMLLVSAIITTVQWRRHSPPSK